MNARLIIPLFVLVAVGATLVWVAADSWPESSRADDTESEVSCTSGADGRQVVPREPAQPQELATPAPAAQNLERQAAMMDALRSDLQTLRSQIEMYRLQHGDRCPGLDPNGQFNASLFAEQLVKPTTADGTIDADAAAGQERSLGPYLQRFPANPLMDGPNADKVSSGNCPAPMDGSTGWHFDPRTQHFEPNHKTSVTW